MSNDFLILVAFNLAFLGVGLWDGYRFGFIKGRDNGLKRGAEITAHLVNRLGPEMRISMVAEAKKLDKELETIINKH